MGGNIRMEEKFNDNGGVRMISAAMTGQPLRYRYEHAQKTQNFVWETKK
jgi:hypothetical protein